MCVCVCRCLVNPVSSNLLIFIDIFKFLTWKLPKGLMNICSQHLDKQISIFFFIFLVIMCFSNLVVIVPSENWQCRTERSTYKGTLGAYTYTRDQLITMSNKLINSKYCILPFDTIKTHKRIKT